MRSIPKCQSNFGLVWSLSLLYISPCHYLRHTLLTLQVDEKPDKAELGLARPHPPPPPPVSGHAPSHAPGLSPVEKKPWLMVPTPILPPLPTLNFSVCQVQLYTTLIQLFLKRPSQRFTFIICFLFIIYYAMNAEVEIHLLNVCISVTLN